MVEKICNNIYQIKIGLPKSPLKELNSYLIKGENKSLLIDTGFNREECKKDLFDALEELEVDLNSLEVFITHLHADHSGNVSEFYGKSPKIYASEIDGNLINEMVTNEYWENIEKDMYMCGLGLDNVKYTDHPAFKFRLSAPVEFTFLKEGDLIEIDDYKLKVIETPGHTVGQIGLYEEKYKLYFSGDHVLDIITPNIAFWDFDTDDLGTYIREVDKLKTLDIDIIFPSHRNIMKDHPRRVNEIVNHHMERLDEVYEILEEEPQSVRNIASKMSWRIRANSWEEFPPAQKWFASGEALSHLEYFYNRDKVNRIEIEGILYYSKK